MFGGKFSLHGLYDKVGMTKEILTRGQHAELFSEYRPWNDEERAKYRSLMTAFYQDFVTRAAEGRKKKFEEIDAVAQGRVWTGTEALEPRAGRPAGRPGRGGRPWPRSARASARTRTSNLVVLPGAQRLHRDDHGAPGGRHGGHARAARGRREGSMRWVTSMTRGDVSARLPFDLRVF